MKHFRNAAPEAARSVAGRPAGARCRGGEASRKLKNYKRWQLRKRARARARNWTGGEGQ